MKGLMLDLKRRMYERTYRRSVRFKPFVVYQYKERCCEYVEMVCCVGIAVFYFLVLCCNE